MRMEAELKSVVGSGALGSAPRRIYQTRKAPTVEAIGRAGLAAEQVVIGVVDQDDKARREIFEDRSPATELPFEFGPGSRRACKIAHHERTGDLEPSPFQ